MKAILALLLACCALGVLGDGSGCSLSLLGNTRLVLDRFVPGPFSSSGVHLSSYTFEAWIRPSSDLSLVGTGEIFHSGILREDEGNAYAQAIVYDYQRKSVRIDVYTANVQPDMTRTWNLQSHHIVNENVGQWIHIAMHLTHGSVTLFINGVLSYTVAEPVVISNPSRRLTIGNNFVGDIDEVKLWDRLLIEEEIPSTMKSKPCTVEGLVLYLPFDECVGNVTADVSSSAACGKIRNISSWDNIRDKYDGGDFRRRFGHWGHDMNKLHPVPFFVDISVDTLDIGGEIVEGRPQEQSKEREYGRHHGEWDREHGEKDRKHGEKDRKHGEKDREHGEKDREHGHRRGDHKCGGLPLIKFGSPSPAVSECTQALSVDVSAQCPYSSFIHRHHDSSASESSEDSDFDSSDDGSVPPMFWLYGCMLIAILSCCSCYRRRVKKNSDAGNNYQVVPVPEWQSHEYADYPAQHPSLAAPQFAVNLADADLAAFSAEQFRMCPSETGMYDPVSGAPLMYYMPQPVYYAPNLEHVNEDNR